MSNNVSRPKRKVGPLMSDAYQSGTEGFLDGLESPEERSARWGAELLAALRLTTKRGLLIHARL